MQHTKQLSVALSIVTLAGVTVAGAALAQEHSIQRSQLPPAVAKTFQAQSEGAQIKGFAREKEHGKTYYEAKTMMNGHSKTIQTDADGEVTEFEEWVAMDSLPAEVKTGLKTKAGKGKITKVESLTKHDKLVAYEAQVMTSGKHFEIQVGPTGETLDHEE